MNTDVTPDDAPRQWVESRPWTPESQADVNRLRGWAEFFEAESLKADTLADSASDFARAAAYRHAIRIITGESL